MLGLCWLAQVSHVSSERVQGLVDNDQEDEEEFEVDIQEDEAAFLKGISSRSGVEMSPIKIVKNPDGSLQRAAMTQSALAKERRELREQQQRTLIEAIPKDLSRPWEDPLPDQGERHHAQELRGIGLGGFEVPEWKKQAEGKVCPGFTLSPAHFITVSSPTCAPCKSFDSVTAQMLACSY